MSSSRDRLDETDPVEDPIAYFLDELKYHGRSDRTRDAYRRVLRAFEDFLDERDTAIREASHRDCLAWTHDLRGSTADSTIATYASYLHRFYDYMGQVDAFEKNPMGLVMEEMDESIDTDPARRDIGIGEMRAFVRSVRHPLDRVLLLLFLKTGIRVGELCNLDLRDVALPSADANSVYDLGTRGALDGHEATLFVAADVERGTVVNGERRTASNKRKRSTLVPIDDEVAGALERWLAIRPDSRSRAEPVFISTRDAWGERLTPPMVRSIVEEYARDTGWYRTGGGAEENVTPHYFRHFFTTHLRDRTGDRGIVKYLRGDVAEDIVDTYTHNWGDRVREVYEQHIYRLL